MIEIDYGNGNIVNVSGLEEGYKHGRNDAIDAVLEILDEVSSDSSAGGEYWNSAKTITVLRRRIMALKGG